jgi:hypothetical protein
MRVLIFDVFVTFRSPKDLIDHTGFRPLAGSL